MKAIKFILVFCILIGGSLKHAKAQAVKYEYSYEWAFWVECINDVITGTLNVEVTVASDATFARFLNTGVFTASDGSEYTVTWMNNFLNQLNGKRLANQCIQFMVWHDGKLVGIIHAISHFHWDEIAGQWIVITDNYKSICKK